MLRKLAVVVGLLALPGCGILADIFNGESGSSTLKRFESREELAEYFADQINARNSNFLTFEVLVDSRGDDADGGADGGAPPTAPSMGEDADSGDGPGDHSNTTTQEVGVDEADVVKTDGSYIYVIDGEKLKVVDVRNPSELSKAGEVAVEGWGREIYLHDSKVVALTETGGGIFYIGGGVIEPMPLDGVAVADDTSVSSDVDSAETGDGSFAPEDYEYQRPQVNVVVIDVAAPGAPRVISTTSFDGSVASSRMIDGVLHLVLANYQDYYYDVMPMLGRPGMSVAPSSVEVEELLPTYEHVDAAGVTSSGSVVTYENLYHPTDPDGFGVVTVVSLDVDNDAAFTAVGVVAQPGLIYSSLDALYLTDTQWDFLGNQRENTDIYKLAYRERAATPVATGTVPGRVLNQYSMGEYLGNLRVATTVGPTWDPLTGQQISSSGNNVYVLADSEGALGVIGSVEHIAPRETIQSARFIGDRGFVVTFEQIDPFFTLDLSDPTNPRVVGELKVPGFSTFIVPMDENHVLTVGQHIPEGNRWTWGVQLSIFDVTDFANPALQHNVVLTSDSGAYSEALWNPKAFTYFAERGLVALPLSIYDYGNVIPIEEPGPIAEGDAGSAKDEPIMQETDPSAPPPDEPTGVDTGISEPYVPGGFEGIVVFRVSADGGFSELGRISSRFNEAGFYWPYFTRGVFVGETVYAVTDAGAHGAPLSNVDSAPYALLFDEPIPTDGGDGGGTGGDDGVIIVDPVPPDNGGEVPASEPSSGG